MRPRRLRWQLASITAARGGINTGFRMIYPFLPVLARGMGVQPQAIILAATARSALGLGAPLVGSLADTRGRKTAMLLGMGVFAAGCAGLAIWRTYPAFVVAMLAVSVCKILFDPAEMAYLGDRVVYARRGLVIALSELGWSGAFLVGVPAVGWLMERTSWSTPFAWLALAAVLLGGWLWRELISDPPAQGERPTIRTGFRSILANPSAIGFLAISLFISAGNETVAIVFGLWLEVDFGLQIAALGAASAVIGLAELGGEGLVAGLADRLGKRRAVAIGIVSNSLAALALPGLGRTLPGALLGLFLFYLTFEFTVVSSLPLLTEQVPQARATLIASNITGFSLGRTLGALAGGPLFRMGLAANCGAAAAINLAALAVLLLFVREHSLGSPAGEVSGASGEGA